MTEQVFAPGQKVRLREHPDRSGYVVGVGGGGSRAVQVLLLGAAAPATYNADSLIDGSTAETRLVGPQPFLARIARVKLRSGLADTLYAMGSARATFEAYQFKPAFKFLDGGCRAILIADEVGLGKTIEAGYIYLEMKARFPVQRTLVICPSGLRLKWQSELRQRFDEEFALLDAPSLREFLDRYAQYEGATPLRGICSLELLRRDEFRERFEDLSVRFDLVIVDEAHHLRNPLTASHEAVETVRAHADALVLLTATPVQMHIHDLYILLELLDPGTFISFEDFDATVAPNARINNVLSALAPPTDLALARERFAELSAPDLQARFAGDPYFQRARDTLVSAGSVLSNAELVELQQDVQRLNPLAHILTRTRKREVESAAVRSPQTLRVNLTDEERAFYQAVVSYVRRQTQARAWGASSFALIGRERQVASCMPAARRYFQELATTGEARLGIQGVDLSDEGTDEEDVVDTGSLAEVLRAGARLGTVDTKYNVFRQALAEALPESRDRKAIVFSFFKRTLAHLDTLLEAEGYDVFLIDGDVPPDQRTERVRAFKDARPRRGTILLSSEVGAEGLDFQFCDTLFNYDLPWNPMRVEQRIGRIDRYGQTSERIRICNFILADTIEERVLGRLYERIDVFHASIGELEPILGETVQQLTKDLFRHNLTPDEERRVEERGGLMLERRKRDLNEFENRKAELLGQDEAIMVALEDTRESGRIVTPQEIRNLLLEALKHERLQRVRLDRSPRLPPGVWELANGRELLAEVQAHTRQERTPGEGLLRLAKLLQREKPVWLTFDSAVAQAIPNLVYLHPRHAFIRYAAEQGETPTRENATACIGRLAIRGNDLPVGECLLCLYLFGEHSGNSRKTLWPVAIVNGRADAALGSRLFGRLSAAVDEDWRPDGADPASVVIEQLMQVADEAAEQERLVKLAEARRRNDAFVNARLQAIERTAAAQFAQAEHRLAAAADPRIQRMYRGRIQNLQQRLDQQRATLAQGRGVSLSTDLVAIAALQLAPPRLMPAAATTQPVPVREIPMISIRRKGSLELEPLP